MTEEAKKLGAIDVADRAGRRLTVVEPPGTLQMSDKQKQLLGEGEIGQGPRASEGKRDSFESRAGSSSPGPRLFA